jgi:excisionase family DNA binding protein
MRVKTQPESKNKNLVTAKEVADLLGVSRGMVERLALQKKLIPVSTPYSLYYFNKAAVLELKETLK